MRPLSWVFLFVGLLVLPGGYAHATIIAGNQTDFVPDTNAASPQTVSHTVSENTTLLTVSVTIFDASATDGVVSEITFGGDSFTLGTSTYDALSDGHVSIWYLKNPTIGAGTISVSFGGTVTDFMASAVDVRGVGFSVDSTAIPATGNGSPTITFSTVKANTIIFDAMLTDQSVGANVSVDSPQIEVHLNDVGSDTVGASYMIATTSGSHTMSWTDAINDEDWVSVSMAFSEDPHVYSGELFSDEGSTPITTGRTIKLAVGTSTPPSIYSTTTDTDAGTFHFSLSAVGSDISATTSIVIWVDGTTVAATVSKLAGKDPVSGLNLYEDTVIVRTEGSESISIADMAVYDNDDNANIPYIATTTGATSTTIFAGNELHIWTGDTFAPDGTVTINGNGSASPDGDFHVDDNATFTQSGLLTLAGNFSVDTGAVLNTDMTGILFNATTTGKTIAGVLTGANSFASTTFNGSGGEWTFSNNASTTDLTITNGTVIAPASLTIEGDYSNSGTFTHNSGLVHFASTTAQTLSGSMTGSNAFNNIISIGTTTFSNNASTTDFTISAGATAVAPATLTISGDYTNTGTFTHNDGLVYVSSTSAQSLSGTLTGTSAFNDLTLNDSGTKTFSDSTEISDLIINSGATAVAPASLTITGDYTNNGTFTHNSGLVTFSSTTPQTLSGTMIGNSAFNNLTLAGTATTTFGNVASTTGTMTANVGSSTIVFPANATSTFTNINWQGDATQKVIFRSSADGTQWGVVVTGTQMVRYVDAQDSNACDGDDVAYKYSTVSNTTCWVLATTVIISGTLYADEGVTPITDGRVVRLASGTSTIAVANTTSDGSGNFSFDVVEQDDATAGVSLILYIATSSSYTATTITVTDSSDEITDLDLYRNMVIVRHESIDANASTSFSNMAVYDYTDDAGIQYTASSTINILELQSDQNLLVWAGDTFMAENASTTVCGGVTVDTGSTLVAPSTSLAIAGDYSNNGTFTHSSGEVSFNAVGWGDDDSGSIDISSNDGSDYAYAITHDDSGAIYVAGSYYNATNGDYDWRIRKYDANGDLATDWGDDDSGSIDVSNNNNDDDVAHSITLDSSGAIYVAGYYSASSTVWDFDWRIQKYDANGDLATDWGDDDSGSIVILENERYDYAHAITHDSSGAIYIAGKYDDPSNNDYDWRIRKYDANGILTTDWGDSNSGSIDISSNDGNDVANAITIDDSGAIYVAGYYNDVIFYTGWRINKYDVDGKITTDWGDDDSGSIDIADNVGNGYAYAITLDDSGAIYIAGSYDALSIFEYGWRISKYDANGDLTTDWGDGNSGFIEIANTNGDDSAYAITHDSFGAIYVAGFYNASSTGIDNDWRIRKYDANGVLTTDWGDTDSGSIDISNNDGDDYARAITLDDSGAIYVAGYYYNLANTDLDWRIRKYDANGDTGRVVSDIVLSGTMTGSSAFNNIDINSSGATTFLNHASTSDFTISAGATAVVPATLTISGDYSNNGILNHHDGTITFDSSSAQSIAGTATDEDAVLNTVVFEGSGTKTFSNTHASTGDFIINTGATVVAPDTTLTIDGNYTNNGTFTHNSGGVFFNKTGWGDSDSGSIDVSNNDGSDVVYTITRDASGAIYVAGDYWDSTNADLDWRIRKYDANGDLATDWGDANSGSIDISNNDGGDSAYAITHDSSGAIYVAGHYDASSTMTRLDWRIRKYDANGVLATDWGDANSGTIEISNNDGNDQVYAITLDNSGAIYVAGFYYNGTNADLDWRIRKYDTNGVLATDWGDSNSGSIDISNNDGNDYALDITLDSSGAIYVAGAYNASSTGIDYDWRIRKYDANGILTTDWGDSNSGSIDISNDGYDYAHAITLDSSGAIYVAGYYFNSTNNDHDWRIRKYDANGVLTTDWGDSNSGSIDISSNDGDDYARAITLDNSGAIYVAGHYENSTNTDLDWRIRKYDANGVLTTDWGDSDSGSIDISSNDGDDYAFAITLDDSGAIYVAGYYYNLANTDVDWRIRKYDANGDIAVPGNVYLSGTMTGGSAFNNIDILGIATTTFQNNASTSDFIVSNASTTVTTPVQISIAGDYTNSGTVSYPVVGTTTFNGTTAQTLSGTMTDTSAFSNVLFTESGTKTFSNNASTSDFTINTGATVVAPATTLTIDGNYTNNGTFTHNSGNITFTNTSPTSFTVATGDLATDWGDSNSGSIDVSENDSSDFARAITLDSSGAIYVAGYYWNSTNSDYDWRIRKYDANGVLTTDWGDSNSGSIDISNTDGNDYAYAITHDSSGAIYVAGNYYNLSNPNNDWRIRKYDANGVLTTDWGDSNSGSIEISNNEGSFSDSVRTITLDDSGAIYVAGEYYNGTNSDLDWRIRKYDANGDLATDWGDSNSGSIDISNNDGPDIAHAITLDDSGAIYVAGYYWNSTNSDYDWRIRKYDANGVLTTDWGDDDSGSIEISNTDGHDEAYAITLDSSGAIYVAGYYDASSTVANYDWRIRKYDANGILATDWGDSDSGSIDIANNDGDNRAYAITHDSSGAIYVASEYYDGTNSDYDWRIRKYDANGDLATDWGDSNSGSIDIVNTDGTDRAYAITHDSSGAIYVAGYYDASSTVVSYDWRIRKYDGGTGLQVLSGNMTDSSAFNDVTLGTEKVMTTLSNNASTSNLTISAGTTTAPTLLSITGDYTNNGIFNANSGTTTFNGISQQTATGTMTGTSAFYNLEIDNSSENGTTSQSVIFGAAASTTNFTIQASSSVQFLSSSTSTLTNIYLNGVADSPIWLMSSTEGTQWGMTTTGTKYISYANVKDSNACSGDTIDARWTYSTDIANNTCWIFDSISISSDADQSFSVDDTTVSANTITITEAQQSISAAAANDLRIVIATTSTDMRWDATDTSAVFGGSASGKVTSNTVSYEQDDAILVVSLDSDFTYEDTLTIDGLSFTSFNSVSTATTTLSLRTDGVGDSTDNATDDKTKAITGTLILANHDAGQVNDNFDSTSVTAMEAFRFKLTPAYETTAITSLVFSLEGIRYIDSGDITNATLYRDNNSDGSVDGGDTIIGGTGVTSITGQTGTITFSTDFDATTTQQNYLLTFDATNLTISDKMFMHLYTTNINTTGSTSLGTIVPSGTVSKIQHQRDAGGGGSSIGSAAPEGASIETGGDEDSGETIGDEPGYVAPSTTGTPHSEWINGSNAYLSDSSYTSTSTIGARQSYDGFNFTIPGTDQVDGIEVRIEAKGSTGAGTIEVVLSWNSGASVTSAKPTNTLTTSDVVYTLGGPSDLWERVWTPGELSDTTFRVRIIAQPNSNTVQTDALQVKVYNSATGGGSGGGDEI